LIIYAVKYSVSNILEFHSGGYEKELTVSIFLLEDVDSKFLRKTGKYLSYLHGVT
jgi:hypothetical protein